VEQDMQDSLEEGGLIGSEAVLRLWGCQPFLGCAVMHCRHRRVCSQSCLSWLQNGPLYVPRGEHRLSCTQEERHWYDIDETCESTDYASLIMCSMKRHGSGDLYSRARRHGYWNVQSLLFSFLCYLFSVLQFNSLWGYLKSRVYTDRPRTLAQLKENIRQAIANR
jgi:hypothetical protein